MKLLDFADMIIIFDKIQDIETFHGCVKVFDKKYMKKEIVNSNNELLLQKRSRFKRINPNKWGVCGGKVDLGETPLEAGIRETLEEIGIQLRKEKLNFLSMDTIEKLHFTVYYIKKDVDIKKCKLQKEEVEELKYFKIEELQELDTEGLEWLESLKKII